MKACFMTFYEFVVFLTTGIKNTYNEDINLKNLLQKSFPTLLFVFLFCLWYFVTGAL